MGMVRSIVVVAVMGSAFVVAAPATGQGDTCFGLSVTLRASPGHTTIGTDGSDVIVGTAGPDRIVAGAGDDHICGRGGADVISGDEGNDWIGGGAGNDRVSGGEDDDVLFGGRGRDILVGNRGDDELRGGRGRDRIQGRRGSDALFGRVGADTLRGGPGPDRCTVGPRTRRTESCKRDDTEVSPPSRPATPTPGAAPDPDPTPSSEPTVPPAASVTFTAAGDYGLGAEATATLEGIRDSSPRFNLALGDLSYRGPGSELEWCSYVRGIVGDLPMQLVAGNHEDDNGGDGDISNFAACLPDRMGSTGSYGAEYYFDVDGLVRVVMIAADSTVDGVRYDYFRGNAHYRWLERTIEGARRDGIPWVVVGMHKLCVSIGDKTCEIGRDLLDLLLEQRVDLVLHGHDHTYQRSKQVTCAEPRTYVPSCVADDGADGHYRRGAGSVWVVAGATGTRALYPTNEFDPEVDYLAAWMGGGDPQAGRGFLRITASAAGLDVDFVGSTTSYRDEFRIS